MASVTATIHNHGGVAPTHALLRHGHHPRLLTHLVRTGEIVRVRQGWYSLPSTPAEAQQAFRVGGRLACISGAAFHGLWVKGTHALHVAVNQDAVRLRSRRDRRVRLSKSPDPSVVVHWVGPLQSSSPWVASPLSCLEGMATCRPEEELVAAAVSAARIGILSQEEWDSLAARLPNRIRPWETLDLRVESFTEALVLHRLRLLGYDPRPQGIVRGVGRVDFILGRRLVIEVDGYQYHADPARFEHDRRRDARLSALGYRVLRFSYRQVVDSWSEVRAAIEAAVSRGDHL